MLAMPSSRLGGALLNNARSAIQAAGSALSKHNNQFNNGRSFAAPINKGVMCAPISIAATGMNA